MSLTANMAGLAYALRDLPVGTAYAVWVDIGATLTGGYAMVTGAEPVTIVRILLILARRGLSARRSGLAPTSK